MKPAKVYSFELEGIEADLIEVETDLNVGLHSFTIVGFAEKVVSEAKERINSALKNSGFKPPTKENRKIVVNLAPADIKKTGTQFDLAIALSYLIASGQIKDLESRNKIFAGELSLDGSLRKIKGSLSLIQLAKKFGFEYVFLPKQNARETALIKGIKIIPVSCLEDLIFHLEGKKIIPAHCLVEFKPKSFLTVSLEEIKGQENAKRALAVAAAGGHNLLMVGPPGAGKSMMAQVLISLLPLLNLEEALEVNQIYSAVGKIREDCFIESRPFRAPHHSASPAALIGGGSSPLPGEITLAHQGLLFLDELPEFRRDVLEALRQPLESGFISVSRVKKNLIFPAKFLLAAAMNPCPCGYFGDSLQECQCSPYAVYRYRKKISGPLLDRIDIQLKVPRVELQKLREKTLTENNLKEKILKAREIQKKRFQNIEPKIYTNSQMSSKQVEEMISFTSSAEKFLNEVIEKSALSARGFFKVLKIARTIADLEEKDLVDEEPLAEAFQYRTREEIFK